MGRAVGRFRRPAAARRTRVPRRRIAEHRIISGARLHAVHQPDLVHGVVSRCAEKSYRGSERAVQEVIDGAIKYEE